MNNKNLATGDLVWAKMKSYPYWPSRIVDPPYNIKTPSTKKALRCVLFFGTRDYAWIADEYIVPHSDEMVQSSSKGSRKVSAMLQSAIDEIVDLSNNPYVVDVSSPLNGETTDDEAMVPFISSQSIANKMGKKFSKKKKKKTTTKKEKSTKRQKKSTSIKHRNNDLTYSSSEENIAASVNGGNESDYSDEILSSPEPVVKKVSKVHKKSVKEKVVKARKRKRENSGKAVSKRKCSTPIQTKVEEDFSPAIDMSPPSVDSSLPSVFGSPSSSDGSPSVRDSPASLDVSPPSLDGTPPSLDGTPLSLDGTPPSLDGTPLSFDGSSPSADISPPPADVCPPVDVTPPENGSPPAAGGSLPTAGSSLPTADGSSPSLGCSPNSDDIFPPSADDSAVSVEGSASMYDSMGSDMTDDIEMEAIRNQPAFIERPQSPVFDVMKASDFLVSKEIAATPKKIGFLGLGMMGRGVCKNLIHSGHKVTVWNRTQEKCLPFIQAGATKGLTPADVVSSCDIIFCCVSDAFAVKSLIFDSCGVLKGLEGCAEGTKGYVEMTTLDSVTSFEISKTINRFGARYLEAPVMGSRELADEGALLSLVAGDIQLFNDCYTCFFAFTRNVYYLSSIVGNGSKMNLIQSMLCGTTAAALAEAMALVERLDLSIDSFLKILEMGPLNCPLVLEKSVAMANRNFTTSTTLKHQQKDLSLVLKLGNEHKQTTSTTAAANELLKKAKILRYADHDVSAGIMGAY